VSLAPDAERGLLWGVLKALGNAGVSRVGLVNVHFDPAHMAVVRSVVDGAREDGMAGLAFPDFTRRQHAARIGGEFATGACHGGSFETSLVLAVDPSLVAGSYRELPAIDLDLASAIRTGKSSFREVGLHEAYCGDPAAATAEEGSRLYDLLGRIVLEECADRWARMGGAKR
jgi:creatinine amidohydrolase